MYCTIRRYLSMLLLLCVCNPILFAYEDIQSPDLCLDSQGNAMAIWDITDNYINGVMVSNKPSGGQWSDPILISDPDMYSFAPRMHMNSQGDCVAIWLAIDPFWSLIAVVGSMKPHDSDTWTTPMILSSSYEIVDQSVYLDVKDSGAVAVEWRSYDVASNETILMYREGSIATGWEDRIRIAP